EHFPGHKADLQKLLCLSENPTDTDPLMECLIGRVQLPGNKKDLQKRQFFKRAPREVRTCAMNCD
ncbi:MAG TPA: hypothetical protein VFS81_11020, partial [Candidatus Binatia bacterium]|nr:hypothetical protein [Candidatus Binatia bacterium]